VSLKLLTFYGSSNPSRILLNRFNPSFYIIQLAFYAGECGKDFLLSGHCGWWVSHTFAPLAGF